MNKLADDMDVIITDYIMNKINPICDDIYHMGGLKWALHVHVAKNATLRSLTAACHLTSSIVDEISFWFRAFFALCSCNEERAANRFRPDVASDAQ